jgi:DNA helicase-4
MSDQIKLFRTFDELLLYARRKSTDDRAAFSDTLRFLRNKPRGINNQAEAARQVRRLCRNPECLASELVVLIFGGIGPAGTERKDEVDSLMQWYASQAARVEEWERAGKEARQLTEIRYLLARYEFDRADNLYRQSGKTINESTYKDLKVGFERRYFLSMVAKKKIELTALLSGFEFSGAEAFFRGNNQYIDQSFYETEKIKHKTQYEKEVKKERALLTTEKKNYLSSLLSRFEFSRAEVFFRENHQYIDQSYYETQRAEHQNRHEQKIKNERQRKEEELKKEEFSRSLNDLLKSDFLEADQFYLNNGSEVMTRVEYDETKAQFVRNWSGTEANIQLDSEQAAAVAAVNGNIQVIARAGSGKTGTLVARAMFLQKHCSVSPNQILVLAFNRKAAEEVRSRLSKSTGDAIPHVMTFHALAYALVHPEDQLLYDDISSEQLLLSGAVQRIIDDHLRDQQMQSEFREMMLSHFRGEWGRIVEGGHAREKDDFLEFRRSLSGQSLRGETIKSFGEKAIADFLFEHDIHYQYERNWWWSERNYRPDFTLPLENSKGLIIEYFGMAGEPEYDEMAEEKRRFWQKKENWKLIEIFPRDVRRGKADFWNHFQQLLAREGISTQKLSDDELWERLRDRAVDRFSMACSSFISRCRKSLMSPDFLTDSIAGHLSSTEAEKRFLPVANRLYSAYMAMLEATGEDDFDGLMQRAIDKINNGETRFDRKESRGNLKNMRYLLIDEYQDFSFLFQRAIDAMRSQNPGLQCFCVGDDWQAINGFAGSDLKFFKNFDEYFGRSEKLYLSTNYRSSKSIVEIGNEVMTGLGEPAAASKPESGQVLWVDARVFEPSALEMEEHAGDVITPMVLRLVRNTLNGDKSVVLLSRRNMLTWYVNYKDVKASLRGSLEGYLDLIHSYILPEHRKRVSISTTHRYKGRERSHVIVLDAVDRSYPLVHPDWIFSRIFGDDKKKLLEEGRQSPARPPGWASRSFPTAV